MTCVIKLRIYHRNHVPFTIIPIFNAFAQICKEHHIALVAKVTGYI